MKLTRYEEETIINFNAGDQTATLYTRDPAIMRKVDALVIEFPDIYKCIRYARGLVIQHINIIELMTYYALGKWIIEVQQEGKDRAKYGERVIDRLSEALTEEFGRGYSRETLRNTRKFYQVYQERISQTLFTEFVGQKSQTLFGKLKKENPFRLSWSHYLILMRAKSKEERDFYEIEAADSNWSVRTLQRQYGSSLYERLLLSTDKDKVKEIAEKGQIIEKPQDVVKDPLVLEFLGLQEKAEYSENELETRIIDHLQEFLMEMGKGFTFVDRQKRFTFDEDSYKVDLVLYNTPIIIIHPILSHPSVSRRGTATHVPLRGRRDIRAREKGAKQRMKLTRYEQETIVNFNAEEPDAIVYTRDKAVMRQLDTLVTEYPDIFKCIGETDIDKTYSMLKSRISYRKPRKISEAKREQARMQIKRINSN